jgi:predicted transcriptional regulator
MNTQPTVDGPPTPESPESPFATVSRRAARRAAARRASTRRHTARDHKDDLERRIVEYLKAHPRSTTGDIAKGLNADRGTVAAGLSHVVRAGEIPKG